MLPNFLGDVSCQDAALSGIVVAYRKLYVTFRRPNGAYKSAYVAEDSG